MFDPKCNNFLNIIIFGPKCYEFIMQSFDCASALLL